MSTLLSILLPVHDAEDRLAANVAALLEVLPDLTHDFDIVIIDDGSTDDTLDVAQELATQYPQISVVRHALQLGLARAIESGLEQTRGEMVIVGDQRFGIEPHDLRRLWHEQKEVAEAGTSADSQLGAATLKYIRRQAPGESHRLDPERPAAPRHHVRGTATHRRSSPRRSD